jgi:formylglycine-generating enzyme required for sulfatase activity
VNSAVLSSEILTSSVGASAKQVQAAEALNRDVFFHDTLADGSPAPELAIIPSGEFMMGAKESEYQAQKSEQPRHEVSFPRHFALTRGTIRRREYNQFLLATDHRRPRPYSWNDLDFPVYNVSIKDAVAYAAWLSEQTRQHYRLPTEAEWEYAARAGTTTMFSFGDKIRREEVNCSGGLHCTRGLFICGIGRPVQVGTLPPNAWGLFEMHGNMQEFTLDHWRDGYRSTPRVGDMPFRSPDVRHRHFHVVRGGSWFDGPGACRSASRTLRHENEIDLNLGFRLLREIYP